MSIAKASRIFPRILIQTVLTSRSYYTSRTKKPTLYSKISPLGNPNTSVVPVLDDWLYKGNKVRVAELHRIIHDLRKRKRFTQALEVSEWMKSNGVCIFLPSDHAVHLDLIGRVKGFPSAESYFNNLKEHDQTDKTYGALLNCYVRQRQIDRSLSHFQKMKVLGLASSSLTYNDIMCLYTNVGHHDKVPDVLTEMKENKVLPDNFSYRICINSFGVNSDIDGMERILEEMEHQPHIVMDWNTYAVVANFYTKASLTYKAFNALKKSEEVLDKKDALAFNHLISLYANLGQTNEVMRLWDVQKKECKRCINRDFINMLESLVRLGALDEAEKVLKEWESSSNCYDFRVPNILIVGYSGKGLYEKAEALLEDLAEKGKATTPNSWSVVADGYMVKGEMEKAVNCFKAGLTLCVKNKGWKPNPKVMTRILSWLGDRGSVEEVEALVGSLRNFIPVNRQMYHALVKANLRSGREVKQILDCMKLDEIDEDEET